MPLSTQAKLLRAIQNQEIQRLGSLTPRKVDVRIIAATNRDLRQCISERTFREDLYYRLSMVEINAPALAEREGDLPLLVRHFTRRFSELYRKPIAGWTRRSEIVIQRHNWPGNVRELENAVGHACMMALGETIDVGDLPPYLWGNDGENSAPLSAVAANGDLVGLEDQERSLLHQALEKCGGNRTAAARMLRISRDTMRYRMKKFGLG
jgi:DNA-binding NtrC family response regulator